MADDRQGIQSISPTLFYRRPDTYGPRNSIFPNFPLPWVFWTVWPWLTISHIAAVPGSDLAGDLLLSSRQIWSVWRRPLAGLFARGRATSSTIRQRTCRSQSPLLPFGGNMYRHAVLNEWSYARKSISHRPTLKTISTANDCAITGHFIALLDVYPASERRKGGQENDICCQQWT